MGESLTKYLKAKNPYTGASFNGLGGLLALIIGAGIFGIGMAFGGKITDYVMGLTSTVWNKASSKDGVTSSTSVWDNV